MSARRKKAGSAATAPRARESRNRQRQRLIDACISALHIHGPSRTTVERVVAIAKMSPGIVRFYFDSKAAMLVASLQFLSAEFDEQVLLPVSKLKANPVAALELLVDLYLDPELASPRKVSVWYAFWGEASSRQEYYDICGQKDENFAALVHELIGRLIEDAGQAHLDTGGVALGLIGALEMTWQDFAFRAEKDIDRAAQRRRCMAYLESVFPGRFAPRVQRGAHPGRAQLAGWAYGSEAALSLERAGWLRGTWQIAGHERMIARAGDYLAARLGAERALVVRDGFGVLHALRNACPHSPHALVEEASGRFDGLIACATHALEFGLDGRCVSGDALDIEPLELRIVEGVIVVRSRGDRQAVESWLPGGERWFEGVRLPDPCASIEVIETEVQANWKLVVEQWLEAVPPEVTCDVGIALLAWSLIGAEAVPFAPRAPRSKPNGAVLCRFIAPNQLLEWRADGCSMLQVSPLGALRCCVRRLELATGVTEGVPRVWDDVALQRVTASAQQGILEFGYRARRDLRAPAALAWFHDLLAARIPALALERLPSAS